MTLHKKGDIVGTRYRIDRYHSAGGMQEVYRATDLVFTRTVALKVPKDGSAQKRFRRSAIVSAQINHPNVAKTFDFLEEHTREYLIEEYVDGENLRDRLDRYSQFDPFLAAHMIHHIARGLSASHHAGVVHRDLKPGNVLVSNEPWPMAVKISDFGIAKMAEEELAAAIEHGIEKSITTSHTLMGALPYMAPEAIKEPKKSSRPADVWSLGAMLYELLSGNRPFGQGLAAVGEILSGKLPPKPGLLGNSNQFGLAFDELWEIVTKCLVQEVTKRLTADQLVKACDRLCYPTKEREEGTVKSFGHDSKPIGFIAVPGKSDVFFHRESYYGGRPTVGQKVAFAKYPGGPRDRAFPVVILK